METILYIYIYMFVHGYYNTAMVFRLDTQFGDAITKRFTRIYRCSFANALRGTLKMAKTFFDRNISLAYVSLFLLLLLLLSPAGV